MRIRIRHCTRYDYDEPATGIVQLLRMTPGNHEGQHIRRWRIDADVDGRFRDTADVFGNRVTMFYAERPASALTLTITGEADIIDTSGVVRAAEPLPSAIFLRATALTEPTGALRELAARFADLPALEALHALNLWIHRALVFDPDATHAATTAAAALAAGRGVCQDFAHIFIAVARALGYPARYVSGHLARDVTQPAAHAWAEALVPDLGWVGFDPANGHCPHEAYLRVAVGLDYLGAAPIRGSRRGGGAEQLTVTVDAGAFAREAGRQSQN